MTELRTVPLQGIPPVLDKLEDIASAAQQLAQGSGAFAIDTERASAFRYDDRAFLLQIRRADTPIFLIDPEAGRTEVSQILTPVLNGQHWVLHAAHSDLPCLAWLGLYPGRVFDTELAARLTGYNHPNLGSMVQELLGIELEKGHSDADWSTRPLPTEWLSYAALDVELLLDLAEILTDILAEQDKLGWAEEEFAAIVDNHSTITRPAASDWRTLKGISALRSSEQLAVAAALWKRRDVLAQKQDKAPGKILSNRVLVEIARVLPRDPQQLGRIKGFPRRQAGAGKLWWNELKRARTTPRKYWPKKEQPRVRVPSKSTWSRDHPEKWALYQVIRSELEDLAHTLDMLPETLVRPATLRTIVWAAVGSIDEQNPDSVAGSLQRTEQLPAFMASEGARGWQIELTIPVIAPHLFGTAISRD